MPLQPGDLVEDAVEFRVLQLEIYVAEFLAILKVELPEIYPYRSRVDGVQNQRHLRFLCTVKGTGLMASRADVLRSKCSTFVKAIFGLSMLVVEWLFRRWTLRL